jgi:hypothetical protein
MRYFWRAVALVVVFVGVGVLVDRLVVAHTAAGGAYAIQVRLGAAMAGLFAGGASMVLVGIAMVWRRGKLSRRE